MTPSGRDEDEVVVIGLACRFPGKALDARSYWSLLCKGQSTCSSSDRFEFSAFQTQATERLETKLPTGAHFIRGDVANFDANFFGISANEAKAMDPQQRIMLEVAYEAFENAAISIETVAGTNTSCYIGNFTTDYKTMLFQDPESAPLHAVSGTGAEMISNRISWFFDLRGPSVTLNTACSSSLVALHQGYQSLRLRESNMALIGGSNLLLNPDMFQAMSKQQFLAKDGLSKSFDVKGDGYGRGEGFAAVILKRLDDAVYNGDPIRAVIRGSGVNQDGKTKGITVPNFEAQADLIRSTYRAAGLDLKDTHYCEAHGTGTKIGDPLELKAISNTFGSARDQGHNIVVGSVKPNIGHLEATAGLASVIKSIYILENAIVPPSIYFQEFSPQMPLEKWNITIPVKATPWPAGGPRRVSVQSFGYGGTNAHIIIDDAYHYLKERNIIAHHYTKSTILTSPCKLPTEAAENSDRESPLRKAKERPVSRLFVLSTQDRDGLRRQQKSLLQSCRDHSSRSREFPDSNCTYIRDLAFTLSEKRSRLAWKSCFIASSIDHLCSVLDDPTAHIVTTRPSDQQRLGFVFTGQGAQWARMGVELNEYPVFRESVRMSDEYLRFTLDCPWSVMEEMSREQRKSTINLPVYCESICTILQLALIDLLESWNISPSAVIGHSSGEIAAAYCLGSLNKQDALKIAYYRGLLLSDVSGVSPQLCGTMMAVEASEIQVQEWIDRFSGGGVVVACVNSPSSVTISGDVSAIEEMQGVLTLEGVLTRRLDVKAAYHSPHMNTVSAPYLEAIKDVQAKDSKSGRQLFSSVTGCIVDPTELGPMSWVRNLIAPVVFYDAFHALLRPIRDGVRSMQNNVDFLIEIGPHSTLKGPIEQIMRQHAITGVGYQSILLRGCDAVQTALSTAGRLFVHGVNVDIEQINKYANDDFTKPPRPLVDLPAYSWDHSRKFWSESRIHKEYRCRKYPQSSLLGAPCPTFREGEMLWRGIWRVSETPWIRDHVVQGSILYPTAGYIAMVVEAAYQVATKDRVIHNLRLRDFQIDAPTLLAEESEIEFILQFRPYMSGTRSSTSSWSEFAISSSIGEQELRQSCHGLVLIEYVLAGDPSTISEQSLEDQRCREAYAQSEKPCQRSEDPKSFYKELTSLGIAYGPSLQSITQISLGTGKSRCTIDIPEFATLESYEKPQRPHVIHPATLDGIFHLVFAASKDKNGCLNEALLPKSIDEMSICADIPFKPRAQLRGICDASKNGIREIESQLVVLDEQLEKSVVWIKGFCWTIVGASNSPRQGGVQPAARRLFSKLIWQPAPQLSRRDPQSRHYTILEAASPTPLSQAIASQLEKLLNAESLTTDRMTWSHKTSAWEDKHCICLMELENSFLASMAADEFAALKECILRSAGLLWVSAGDDPRSDLVLGLARTVRNEIPGKSFRTLRFQSLSSPSISRLSGTIRKIATVSTTENEFKEEEGVLKISRLVEDTTLNKAMSSWMTVAQDYGDVRSTQQVCRPQKLTINTPGVLDALCLETEDNYQNDLGVDEVEIEVKATGLNFRDVMVAMGQIPDNLLGFDLSGIVVRAGKDVTRLRPGDAICALGHGTHRSLFRNKASFCQLLPRDLSFEEAATLPLAHCTATYALIYVARLRQGQSVLIHAGAGGVGQAAIQIAKHLGAEIFTTVGSTEKRRLIKDAYGIAEDHIFDSRNLHFARGVLRMTDGRGVDCVLNSLSGTALQETWRCIAPFGTFVEIGIKDIMNNSRLEMRPFLQDASFTCINLQHIMTQRSELMINIIDDTFDFLRRGITKPVFPVVVYPISEVEGAFRLMQTGRHKGKIALSWSPRLANLEAGDTAPSRLDPNASYLLVGGLGGLGRSLANLLVCLGARNLCFISRSGDQSSQAKSLIQTFGERNIQTRVYRCNIANAEQLAETLKCCGEEYPIKGVLQCAMVLDDTVFEKMAYQQWVNGLQPKVQGSWNLHTLLPRNLDFHITLSSFVGIFGNRSQSNYAAGGAYQDALAFHRRSLGLKAVTVDLGIMRDVGGLAEHGSTSFIKEWEEPFGIREYELHGLMRRIVTSELGNTGAMPAQIITGFATGGSARAAGIRRPFYFDDPRFSILAETGLSTEEKEVGSNVAGQMPELRERLARAETLPDAARAVREAMVARVAKSLQTDVSEIDEHRPLYTYGIDSLVAVELSDWIFKQTKVVAAVLDILASRPISDFALHLASKSQFVRAELRPT